MIIVVACMLLFVAGFVLVVAWGGGDLVPPEAELRGSAPPDAASVSPIRSRIVRALRRYLWWATVVTVAGVASGILVAGAGGRLIMRVLALTSPVAIGRITEAHARVGDITLEGTVAFLLFGALPGALVSALLFALVHRWLPRGRLGGVLFGALLLVTFSSVLEPLRAGNIDFAIVGPGWLSTLLFSVLVVLQGMLVAAIAARYSRMLPLHPARPLRAYSPLVAAIVYVPAGLLLLIGGVLVVVGTTVAPAIARWWSSRAATLSGRVALAVLAIVSLPGFIGSVASIVGR